MWIREITFWCHNNLTLTLLYGKVYVIWGPLYFISIRLFWTPFIRNVEKGQENNLIGALKIFVGRGRHMFVAVPMAAWRSSKMTLWQQAGDGITTQHQCSQEYFGMCINLLRMCNVAHIKRIKRENKCNHHDIVFKLWCNCNNLMFLHDNFAHNVSQHMPSVGWATES